MPRVSRACIAAAMALSGLVSWTHAPGSTVQAMRPYVLGSTARAMSAAVPAVRSATPARVRAAYGRLPLLFERNDGQEAPGVLYTAHGRGYAFYLGRDGVTVLVRSAHSAPTQPAAGTALPATTAARADAIGLRFIGANTRPQVIGASRQASISNFFIGANRRDWHTGVPTFARVVYRRLYRGIDAVFYGTQGHLEYDVRVAPGADPRLFRLGVTGAQRLSVDRAGRLVLRAAGTDVVQAPPVAYQMVQGARRRVAVSYRLGADHTVGFALGRYDARAPLTIDPSLKFSTYLGGSSYDGGTAIAVVGGSAFVTGFTYSFDFPTSFFAFQSFPGGQSDAFVTKLNSAGTAVVYSTYLGGKGDDIGTAIAADSAGNAYVAGMTSGNFPITPRAYQRAFGGVFDGFVTKLNLTGSALLYSTYLGGSSVDAVRGIAVNPAGNAFVTGYTLSTNFPTANPIQPANAGAYDAFVTKLSVDGSFLAYSTYVGGSGTDYGYGIALSDGGNPYITGQTNSTDFPTLNPLQAHNGGGYDAFVTKLNLAGTGYVYSTYLGGSADDSGTSIAVGKGASPFVAGWTDSTNFPTAQAIQPTSGGGEDGFVSKIITTGNSLMFSTYLGGAGTDVINGVSIDSKGAVYLAGTTNSANFPLTNTLQGALDGPSDAFVSKMAADGSVLLFSTYLGGHGADGAAGIAVDAAFNTYITGVTDSVDFPTTRGAFSGRLAGLTDAFVTKLGPH